MNGYSATHYFPELLVELFRAATEAVARIPEPEDPDEIRCHELTRALSMILPRIPNCGWTVVDGRFGSVDHSWLDVELAVSTPTRHRHVILDCYAVARIPMVQLVDPSEWPVWLSPLYRPNNRLRTDINVAKVAALAKLLMDPDTADLLMRPAPVSTAGWPENIGVVGSAAESLTCTWQGPYCCGKPAVSRLVWIGPANVQHSDAPAFCVDHDATYQKDAISLKNTWWHREVIVPVDPKGDK